MVEWKLGSHMSVAGGLHLALDAAANLAMTTCQIFTKNASQWNAKPLTDDAIQTFADTWQKSSIEEVFSHASYLINLASPKDDLRQKSIDSLLLELERASSLGLRGVVVHPGAFVSDNPAAGIARFRQALDQLLAQYEFEHTQLIIENTAGQGTTLGRSVGELAEMLMPYLSDPRVGLCIDSCHAHAAGYDLSTAAGLETLVQELADQQLLDKIRVIHLNDSKKPAGSHVDRHHHLGQGTIGEEGIARFIHHPEMKRHPMILETEKGLNKQREDWDWVNMRLLYKLIGQEYPVPGPESYV